jgi:type II secretory pathway pseudopilin PulG
MFSLIITIISIALVAALAVATLYYGGQQFSQGTAKANADQLISAAQQIAGANTLFANANSGQFDTNAAGVTDLVNNQFLSAVPSIPTTVSGSTFDLAGGANTNQITLAVTNTSVCTAVAKQSGSVLSTASAPNPAQTGKQYDCFGAGAPYTFVFNG